MESVPGPHPSDEWHTAESTASEKPIPAEATFAQGAESAARPPLGRRLTGFAAQTAFTSVNGIRGPRPGYD